MGWAARPGRAIAFSDWSGGREWVWALALTRWGPVLEQRPKQDGTYRSLEPKGETLGLGKE